MITKKLNNCIFVPLLILFLFLQLTLVPQLFSDFIRPDLVLLLLIAASFLSNSESVFYAAFLSGFLLDIFSGVPFGAGMLCLILSVFVSFYLGRLFIKELFSAKIFLVSFFIIVFYNFIYFFLNEGNINKAKNEWEFFIHILIFGFAYAAILIIPLTLAISYKISFENK